MRKLGFPTRLFKRVTYTVNYVANFDMAYDLHQQITIDLYYANMYGIPKLSEAQDVQNEFADAYMGVSFYVVETVEKSTIPFWMRRTYRPRYKRSGK